MSKISLHIFSGWAYPARALQSLKELLSDHYDVTVHPFNTDHSTLKPIGPYILAGWSLGALQAIKFVSETENKPEFLVLLNGTSRFCETDSYTHGTDRATLISMLVGIRRNQTNTLHTFFNLASEPEGQPYDPEEEFTTEELYRGLTELKKTDLREILPSITTPALLLHGENDKVIPCSASEYLADHLPNVRLEIKKGAGHELPRRHPSWIVEKVLNYSAGIS